MRRIVQLRGGGWCLVWWWIQSKLLLQASHLVRPPLRPGTWKPKNDTVAPDSLRGAEQTPVPLHGDLGWPAAKMARVDWSGLARSSYPKLTIPALALSSGVIHYAKDGMVPLFELISRRMCLLFIPGA
jgi:hypothetical protein